MVLGDKQLPRLLLRSSPWWWLFFVVFVLTGTTRARPSTWSPRTTQRSAVSSAQWAPTRWLFASFWNTDPLQHSRLYGALGHDYQHISFGHLARFIPLFHTLSPRWHCTHQCVYMQWRDAQRGVKCVIQPWLKNSKYNVYCCDAAPI